MEGEKDDIPIKEIINEFNVALENLKEANGVIEGKLQEIEQDYVNRKKTNDKFNGELAAGRVIDNPTVDPFDCVDQFMMKVFKPFREFNIEMKEKLKELETFFEIDNEALLSEIEERFLNLAEEIAKMLQSVNGQIRRFNKNKRMN